MLVFPATKLEAVCSKDPARPALSAPWYEAGRVYATDGKALVSLPAKLTEESMPRGATHLALEAVRAAAKAAGKYGDARLDNRGTTVAATGATYSTPHLGTPPAVETVIPRALDSDLVWPVDVALLRRLCDALGESRVIIRLPRPAEGQVVQGAALVEPLGLHSDGRLGVAMSMRLPPGRLVAAKGEAA